MHDNNFVAVVEDSYSGGASGRPCHDSHVLSMPDIPHLLEEPDQPQANSQNAEAMVLNLCIPESGKY